ncbi:Very-long-chain (3R)-3-hydroxyacyl-CoA dehydratase 2 [Trichoplax sp. H2]|uniref:Very-long-chain (3R)-3-hydroxyacyl-CoA dehydratase n=1 Tax=Trichoplax adhaerens TaxID=10228 RepID=B3S149_TRIAD|nr:expressed hypothetical protein [Trichoplax adhaerens]EDV23504.1 expressed hypothetical protein [Trichoplax adhaerens]RDD47778.1 Very-long-chain (3R)-3-hydroxyacyl-CoA dehydratase 2 [Trichoplax sp. H2]|eukprot:XP_002114414.1 expressed hypothetical protein [Trichoplax adhaerens]
MAEEASKRKGPGMLGNFYLLLYNVLQTIGWSAILVKTCQHYHQNRSLDGFYKEIHQILKIFQSAAILEVFHCAIGLVRANVVLTAFQVASRLIIYWGVILSVKEIQDTIAVELAVMAWTITEIIRYSYYTTNIIGFAPYILSWLRYTLFIVLYPCGVSGELLCIIYSLPYVAKRKLYSYEMPNDLNMSFDYYSALIFISLLYIPIFPQLYGHMFRQRRKCLSPSSKAEKTD